MKKISKDLFVVLLNCAVQCFFILIYIPFSIGFNAYGLLIGGGFGLVCSSLNIILILKGSSSLLNINYSSDGKPVTSGNKGFFILFYFIRTIVTIGFLVISIVFYYALHIEVFKYSFIPLLISLTVIIGMIPLGDSLYNKIFKLKNLTELKSSNEILDNNNGDNFDNLVKTENNNFQRNDTKEEISK